MARARKSLFRLGEVSPFFRLSVLTGVVPSPDRIAVFFDFLSLSCKTYSFRDKTSGVFQGVQRGCAFSTPRVHL
ncbi:MAG: hypothetical protein ACYCTV_06155 [Leptospirales bacterium]